MRGLNTRLSRWLLGGAIYLTGWYSEGPALQASQMGAISLLLLAGFFSALSGDTLKIRPSLVEWLFGIAFLFAMLVAWMTGNVLSTMYGAMLLLVLVAIAFLIRHRSAAELIAVFRWAYVALVGTVLALESPALFASLVGSVEYGLGLVRYQPLGMHPNLSGLVYGGGALLFLQRWLAAPTRSQKGFALAMVALCLCVLLAASARAGMLALAVAGATGISLIALRGSRRSRMSLVLAALIGVGVVLFNWAAIKDYLSLILDIDSPTRGVESGATGRTDIWRAGIELVFSDASLLFAGRGIRSALPEIIGFPVESSYINLALEHGIFFGSLITLSFVVTAGRALQQGLNPGQHRYQLFMVGLMLVFMLAQSFFNRYLIGVGNPYSLWILVLLLQVNLSPMATATHRSRNASRSTLPSHSLDRIPT
ncbi:MAG: O-antigen ligase family protein [Pseudotabrizicola sp.]|uniref:O-antigen ligase family protein n=1 Tax=Pseudotabrizicola sp. TaxID=2939647 RepID=UPI002720715C|nr:O-antigen ligase family protein [Pseudotabrizicola sp.]MDO9638476.1 O-antigen ligase family protein [Pseudotabrizicola sp.]